MEQRLPGGREITMIPPLNWGERVDRMRAVLQASVQEVRASERLTDSPCCLVVPEGEGPKLGKLRVAALRAALVGGGVTKKRLQLDAMPVPGEEVISEIGLTRGGKGAKGKKGKKR